MHFVNNSLFSQGLNKLRRISWPINLSHHKDIHWELHATIPDGLSISVGGWVGQVVVYLQDIGSANLVIIQFITSHTGCPENRASSDRAFRGSSAPVLGAATMLGPVQEFHRNLYGNADILWTSVGVQKGSLPELPDLPNSNIRRLSAQFWGWPITILVTVVKWSCDFLAVVFDLGSLLRGVWKSSRPWYLWKVSPETSHSCLAMLLPKYAPLRVGIDMHTCHLYLDAAPMCIAYTCHKTPPQKHFWTPPPHPWHVPPRPLDDALWFP